MSAILYREAPPTPPDSLDSQRARSIPVGVSVTGY